MIKLASAWVGQEEIYAVTRVLSGLPLNMGTETKAFEEELHSFFGRKESKVVCVNSCTAALQLAVQACGIGNGDEVLVPTYTFVATFQAIKATGATPIPCDIDVDDVFINLDDAKSRLTNKTKAIVQVLFAGCDKKIDKVYQFARENSLNVIEDAAHCFGCEDIAKRDGILCFSFDAIKSLTCSDGACVLTIDEEIANKINDLRLLGVIGDTEARYSGKRSWDFDVTDQGWRYHMSNVCAAIGRAQLKKFGEIRKRRQLFANMYLEGLKDIDALTLLPINAKTAVPYTFPVILNNGRRNELQAFLFEKGIMTGVQYKPNHILTYFNLGYELPNAMKVYENVLSLPLHPALSSDDVLYVIDSIKSFFKE